MGFCREGTLFMEELVRILNPTRGTKMAKTTVDPPPADGPNIREILENLKKILKKHPKLLNPQTPVGEWVEELKKVCDEYKKSQPKPSGGGNIVSRRAPGSSNSSKRARKNSPKKAAGDQGA
jgi:hypothetical protein